MSDKTGSLIWSTSSKCISHLITAVTLNIYQGQVSPLRPWWTADVCASVLPLMWAPAQVCGTRSGPNGSFEACTHKSVSTNTHTLVTSDLNLKPEAAWGNVMSWIGTARQADWLTDTGHWLLLMTHKEPRLRLPHLFNLFILLLVSYLVPKLINVPTSALLYLVDAFVSTPTICLNWPCKW